MKLRHSTENGNQNYYLDDPKPFLESPISQHDVRKAFDFAFEMCFGAGHHRDRRTGGQYDRKGGEKFSNTFQGKLAEIYSYNFFKKEGFEIDEPDFEIYGKGKWDDTDLIVKGKKINIKSMAHFSNLLLLETKDWNDRGEYIPNLNVGTTSKYDYFIVVRLNPDIKSILRDKKVYYSDSFNKSDLEEIVLKESFNADIPGYITHSDLLTIIADKHILPQNAMLNGKTKMDAENYYVQCKSMKKNNDLVAELKSIIL